jgi:L-malate glycosyltransferase
MMETVAATPQFELAAAKSRHILFIIDQLKKPFGGGERVLLKIVASLPPSYRATILTFASNLSESEIAQLPCPLMLYPLRRTYDFHAIRMASKLVRFIRQQHVDLVHTFFESSDIWAGTISRIATSVPVISSRRDMGILRQSKHRVLYRLLSNCPHRVIAVSEQVRQFVISTDKTPARKVITIYNGLTLPESIAPPARAAIRQSLGVSPDCTLVMTVGNIRRVKGFDLLIQAASAICQANLQVKFVVVGGVNEEDHYRQLLEMVSVSTLQDRFQFLGESHDVSSLLQAADIFVLPSRNEGFSNALIEAMAAGVPCVATDVGGNAEAIVEGVDGFIVPPENVEILAEKLKVLIECPELAARMGASSRERVKQVFTHQAMMSKLLNVYRELLD